MTESELAAIEARANEATPGPWEWCEVPEHHHEDRTLARPSHAWWGPVGSLALEVLGVSEWLRLDDVDAAFIAHARTDVPALLAEVRRLRSQVDELNAALAVAGAAQEG